MEWSIFGVLTAFGWVFGCAVIALILAKHRGERKQERLRMIHEERMRAMEKNLPLAELPELDPDAEERLGEMWRSRLNPRWPLGLGALLIFAGLGMSAALRLAGDPDLRDLWSFGLIGVFLGVGFIVHYLLTRPAAREA